MNNEYWKGNDWKSGRLNKRRGKWVCFSLTKKSVVGKFTSVSAIETHGGKVYQVDSYKDNDRYNYSSK